MASKPKKIYVVFKAYEWDKGIKAFLDIGLTNLKPTNSNGFLLYYTNKKKHV
jgi:hypothetical protein